MHVTCWTNDNKNAIVFIFQNKMLFFLLNKKEWKIIKQIIKIFVELEGYVKGVLFSSHEMWHI